MSRVLIAFDGSPSSRVAVDRAAALFAGAEAVVVSVASGLEELADAGSAARTTLPEVVDRRATKHLRDSALAESRAVAEHGAERAATAGFASPSAKPRSADGAIWAALVGAAHELEADAIVCGTHGHGVIARAILGSVAAGLARHADLPVLVVPEGAKPADGPILIGYDASEPSTAATTACGRLMPGRDALVVYAWK